MTQVPASILPVAGLAGTAGVSTDTSRLTSRENLDKAGERFEAIFTGMMLKSMRQAKLGDSLFDSKAGQQFRDMFDTRLAEGMAASAPMGIGRAVTEFLARSQENLAEPPADGSVKP